MSDRNDRTTAKYGTGEGSDKTNSDSLHLAEELLNSYLDNECTPAERSAIDSHLALCPVCQSHLKTLRGTQLLLSGLPTPALRRSFQLSAASLVTAESFWSRLRSRLLPALPAMRMATAALALLFVAVTIRNAVTDTSNDGAVSDSAMIVQATEQPFVPTAAPGDGRNTAQIESNQVLPTQSTFEQPVVAEPDESAPGAAAPANVAVEETDSTDADSANLADSAPASLETQIVDSTTSSSTDDATSPEMESSLAGDSAAAKEPSGAAARTSDEELDGETSSGITSGEESAGDGAEINGTNASGSGGASDSTFAMIVPSNPESATPLPSTPPAVTAISASPTPESTVATLPTMSVTPVSVVPAATESDDDSAVWTVIQVALGITAGILLLLVVVLQRRRQTTSKTAS